MFKTYNFLNHNYSLSRSLVCYFSHAIKIDYLVNFLIYECIGLASSEKFKLYHLSCLSVCELAELSVVQLLRSGIVLSYFK